MPVFKADGSDFFSVYEAAGKAIEHSRSGGGPSVVYATMMRYFGHFEGDPQLYRAKDETKILRETVDCLRNFRAAASEQKLMDVAVLDKVDEEVMALIEQSVQDAKAAPRGAMADVLTDVYINY